MNPHDAFVHALPESKLAELGRIADARVVTPEAAVRKSKRGKVVGYRMPFLADAEPLGRLFARSFKERHGLGPDRLVPVARELRDRVSLFPSAGRHVQVRVPELDGHEIVAAHADHLVASLIHRDGHALRRAILRADAAGAYDLASEPASSADPLALVALPSGVAVRVREDDRLELFSTRPGSKSHREIDDPGIGADWRLTLQDARVLCSRAGRVYRVSVRRHEPQEPSVKT
ncbi:MAG TPA: hypothetical protein ENK57_17115 [Polyangiaceae bacterium]|nr:hypothetical protein [Polyangiaceae bacterium]